MGKLYEEVIEDVVELTKMEQIYNLIRDSFDSIVKFLIMLVEAVGIAILVYAIVAAVIGLFKRQLHVRLKLAEGIALALEFKMGAELLHTVITREWPELLILGGIILLRAALTFLIQWEIKIERKNGTLSEMQLKDIKTPLTQDLEESKPTRSKKKTDEGNKQE